MGGFISESVGKIADGFINAIKLLLFYILTSLIFSPVENLLHLPGVIVYVFILIALAAFELNRSLAARTSDQQRAWKGMASGLYFWQAFRFTVHLGSFKLFEQSGILFWVMLVLFTATLWKRILPIGVKTGLLVFLTCWLGRLYFMGYSLAENWRPVIMLGYESLRYLAGAVGVLAILFIIYRSRNSESRSYAAIIIFNAALYIFRAF